MYYRYQPYPYYRRYYNLDPYYYRKYYYPYYNVVDSQVADVDQSIINYGDMTDVIQDSDIYQSMTPEPEKVTTPVETNPVESVEPDPVRPSTESW
jgi:hypothetical protein